MDKYSSLYENFKHWFENHPLGLAKKTEEQYIFIIKKMLVYLDAFNVRTLNDISHESFVKFIGVKPSHTPYAESSIIQRVAALNIFFSWAEKGGWVRENNNPVVYYKKTKIHPKSLDNTIPKKNLIANILTSPEQKKLIRCAQIEDFLSARNYCIALLIIATGLYVEEVSALQKDEVNLNKGYLLLHKGSTQERKVSIDLTICAKACKEWNNYRKEIPGEATNPLYFLNRKNKRIKPNRLYEIVSILLSKNGIKKNQMGPDLLRQTAIFNMLKNGLSVEEIKKMTGITTSSYIEKYIPFV